jgi:arylsulfatase A-like enzyme
MTGKENSTGTLRAWRALAVVLVVGTAWVLFEWLFFATKPSFMSLYSPWEKFGVLSSTTLVVAVALLSATLPLIAAGWVLSRLKVPGPVLSAVMFFPTILLLAMVLLVLIDNFSLTVLGWGVRNASGGAIYAYRLLTVGLLVAAALLLYGSWRSDTAGGMLKAITWAAGLLVLCSAPFLLSSIPFTRDDPVASSASGSVLHNILILSGDGISSKHMSVYGYERPTTPFLDSIRDEFLIAENHFSNASDTGGSIVSLLSGKLPTTTRVVYPPDALRGQDSFQHLPGLLRELGYYNADISMRHYADPYDLNMRGGFAEANFRRLKDSGGLVVATIRAATRKLPALNPASLLLDRMSERLSSRYGHIWKDEKMQDPLAEVNRPDLRWVQDDERMAEIRRLLQTAPRPFFVHVLTMGTHGERFRPSQRIYSTEDDYETPWHIGGYDDAIMDFDRMVQESYELLQELGLLESTVMVVSSDHGFVHNALDRVPMLMRLPGRSRTGSIAGNTQRLDIAPTLLEILGLPPRAWMEGQSMLRMETAVTSQRPVFGSGSHGEKAAEGNFWSVKNPVPPWYSLGRLFLVYCDQGFILHLGSMEIEAGRVAGSNVSCEEPLSADGARRKMLEHLKNKGYETP